MADGLHLALKNTTKNFDASYGVLKLPQAGSFTVTIKEYEEKRKKIERKKEEDLKASSEQYQKDIQFAQQKWKERAGAGWSETKLTENWDANAKIRDQKYKAATEKILADYQSQISELNKVFSSVEWVWTLATSKIDPFKLNHNESVAKGIQEFGKTLNFPTLLEGGGLAYVEAFLPATTPKGKSPFGMLVQAKGTPRILRIEWTDFNYNSLKDKKVKFGSSVLLHIYTEGLYGQELGVYFLDRDLFTYNDKLKIGGKDNFEREVLIHKVLPFEKGKKGVADTLVKADQPQNDNKVEKEYYLQKIMIEVSVEWLWMMQGGNNLKIYPAIKSFETNTYFEDFEKREYLEVGLDGIEYTASKAVTNMPVLVGEVETNYAAFHPCQYTELLLEYEEKKETKKVELFKQNTGVSQPSDLEVGIIVGSDPKKFSIKTDDKADTQECRFHGKANDHNKNVFTYDKTKLPKNITISNNEAKKIDGQLFFDYDMSDMLKYFWLSNDFTNVQKFYHININAQTCRYQKKLALTVLPDIEWELAFIITTMAGFRIKADSTTYTRLEQGLGDYQFKGIKAEQAGKLIEKGGVGYSLNIKYSINGNNYSDQLSIEFVRSIEKIIDTYNAILKFVSIFKSDNPQYTSAAISNSTINKITFDIDPPAVIFLLRWKYDYAKKNGQAVVNFTGGAGFKPLIGIKIGVDLVQNADKFGGLVGAIIKWLARFIKERLNTDLYIIVEVGAAINYEIGLSYNEIDGFAPNTKQKITVEVSFSFKAGIKKKDIIFIGNTKRMQGNTIPTNEAEQETFKIEGAVSTGIRYTEEHGYEKGKGAYKKTEIKWLGAEMTITVVTLATNRKQNAPPNNQYKEKFTILEAETIYGPETTYTKE